MNRKSLGALVALNAALLLAAAVLTFLPQPAEAQLGGGGGDYTMISALRSGRTARTIYILDTRNNIMLAVEPGGRNELKVVQYKDITGDFEGRAGGR